MHVVVIGGTGHIGSFLVPRLVEAGHEVTVVARGQREPYSRTALWRSVSLVSADREAEEAAGTFGSRIADLHADIVVDLICFTLGSARHLVDALRGRVQHLLHCGSIWAYGPTVQLPMTEDRPRRPIEPYGEQKAAIETYLHAEARLHGFPATVIHPGHITGPGWVPINPAGNVDVEVFDRLAAGAEVVLPDGGMTTLQHVHADDVARVFLGAIANRSVSVGETFNAVADTALTLRGFAGIVGGWFGQEADLRFLPWAQWRSTVREEDARVTESHLRHSPFCSNEKARRLLGVSPRYTSAEAVREAVDALVSSGLIEAPSPVNDARR